MRRWKKSKGNEIPRHRTMILLGIIPIGPLSNRPPSKHNTPESKRKTFFFVSCPLCWKYCFQFIHWGVRGSSGKNKAGQSGSDCVSCSAKAHISLIPRKKIASFYIPIPMYWNYKQWNNNVQHGTLDLTLVRQPGVLSFMGLAPSICRPGDHFHILPPVKISYVASCIMSSCSEG